MNVRASTSGDGTRDVLRHLLTASVLRQITTKGAYGKAALCGIRFYGLVIRIFKFVLLPTCRCCVPYGLRRIHSAKSAGKHEAACPTLQVLRSRRHQKLKEL